MSLVKPRRLSNLPVRSLSQITGMSRETIRQGGDPMRADRRLSEPWTGRTIFNLLRQPLPEGWEWVRGRATRIQRSNRPPTIWPELWKVLSSKQKEQAAREWALEKPKLEAAQAARGFKDVPADDNEYLQIIDDARTRLAQGEAPAMLCIPHTCYARGDPCSAARGVKEAVKNAGAAPASNASIKTILHRKDMRVLIKWLWCISRFPSRRP